MAKEETKKIVITRACVAGGKDLEPGATITLPTEDAVHLMATSKAMDGTAENIKIVKARVSAAKQAAESDPAE